ncbi:unnamed protein product [Medioppia subpectinata]|uniref:ABC transporter domain-containing protein n=1 Tax=Medioppia subpectinata TaxID=1979941 RepID=A0A7R9KEW8_9ACAR|nr:unnamed protein product [Medioppia subpectinata]CAG2102282.1 unnamed protein product [Medioppia subpectinata]
MFNVYIIQSIRWTCRTLHNYYDWWLSLPVPPVGSRVVTDRYYLAEISAIFMTKIPVGRPGLELATFGYNGTDVNHYAMPPLLPSNKRRTITAQNVPVPFTLSPLSQTVSVSWHNICVYTQVTHFNAEHESEIQIYLGRIVFEIFDFKPIQILKNVSGEVNAGQLLAIMGSSGAGKTTLLNVLTARNLSKLTVKGTVRLNGQAVDANTITSVSSYVQQQDLFVPVLTVREHLVFNSLLRMDPKLTKAERTERVNALIHEFSLTKCADIRIGSSTTVKGISGGESKRLAFASELMTNPAIMFCDEPTSGLDSFMAENIVQTLNAMAAKGRTIICTIHQPSSQAFKLFERLLLIADGRVAYMGNIGKEICDNYTKNGEQLGQNGDRKEASTPSTPGREDSFTEIKPKSYADMLLKPPKYRVSYCQQFRTLLWRCMLVVLREPAVSQVRLLQTVVIAVIVGIVYWNQKLDQKSVMNINGALFLLVTNMSFQNTMAVINTFCAENPLFFREHHNGMYRVDVYFISKSLTDLPIFLLIPMIFVSIYYYMVGFNPDISAFLIAILIGILITSCAVSFGYFMSCLTSSANVALSLGPPLLLPVVLFGGFFLNADTTASWLSWFKYISWFYYGFASLIINQWRHLKLTDCPAFPSTPPAINGTAGQYMPIKCISDGLDIIHSLSFDENDLLRNLILMMSDPLRTVTVKREADSNASHGSNVTLPPLEQTVSVSWHNIDVYSQITRKCYHIRAPTQQPIQILKNVSGEVNAGQLMALMGASGAGKTTLLNVLTGRNLSKLTVKGTVRLNGQAVDANTITSVSSYVQQLDIFVPVLTVREHLVFNLTKAERTERVNALIHEFSLTKCADTYIGSSTTFKGISGGQSKRLAFASELMTNPAILFCDEPTSGLDSMMAANIVQTMKAMAAKGRTIICTIHQPSSQTFKLFERLLLIADGRVAYMGTIGKVSVTPGREDECKVKIKEICDNYTKNGEQLGENGDRKDASTSSTPGRVDSSTGLKAKSFADNGLKPLEYRASYCQQLRTLLWRCMLVVVRDPAATQVTFLQTLVIAVILGIVFWGQKLDQKSVMNINGALFMLVINMSFQSTMAVINTFCPEYPLFLREHHNGMYRVNVYFLAKSLTDLPIILFVPMLFVGIYYYMVGFNPEISAFLMAILIVILVTSCAVSFGYLLSCLTSSADVALALGPPLLIPMVLFGGFFLNADTTAAWLSWVKYLSWVYYGFSSMIINQWRDLKLTDCPAFPSTPPAINGTAGQYMPIKCISDGLEVIHSLSFDENDLLRNLILMVILALVFRLMAFIALYVRSRER